MVNMANAVLHSYNVLRSGDGKSRYIGTFDSEVIASAAYETARDFLQCAGGKRNQKRLSEEEAKYYFQLAKKAVFDALLAGKLSEKEVISNLLSAKQDVFDA